MSITIYILCSALGSFIGTGIFHSGLFLYKKFISYKLRKPSMYSNTELFSNMEVYGNAKVYSNAKVYGPSIKDEK